MTIFAATRTRIAELMKSDHYPSPASVLACLKWVALLEVLDVAEPSEVQAEAGDIILLWGHRQSFTFRGPVMVFHAEVGENAVYDGEFP